jgi:hypothetical protein
MVISLTTEAAVMRQVREAIAQARARRYPTTLILVEGELSDEELWAHLAPRLKLAYTDLLETEDETLQQAVRAAWPELAGWMRQAARASTGMLFVGVDELATRWDDIERAAFFRKLLRSEAYHPTTYDSVPIVVISRLAADLDLPPASADYGAVLDLTGVL